MKINVKSLSLIVLVLIVSVKSYSRPEYAARLGINNCMACHFNPSGGGPRNPNGKFYGWRGMDGLWNGEKKYWHVDLKMNALMPNRVSSNSNGIAMMSAVVGATLPILKGKNTTNPEEVKSSLVINYDMGSLGANATRDTYIQYNTDLDSNSVVMLGKFIAPFGLLTDEHRGFTRLQTKSTINDFEMGALYATDLSSQLHFDIALTSGFAQGGKLTGGTENNPEQTGAVFLNTRYSPSFYPGFVGLSYSAHQSLIVYNVQAASAYTVLSLDRTSLHFPISLITEIVWAKGWNNQTYNGLNIGQFVPGSDMALQAALEKSESLGSVAGLDYELNNNLVFQYRYDRLALDQHYSADVYQKHGIGVKHFFTSATNLIVRYEKADSNVQEVLKQSVRANKDSFYLIFSASL